MDDITDRLASSAVSALCIDYGRALTNALDVYTAQVRALLSAMNMCEAHDSSVYAALNHEHNQLIDLQRLIIKAND